MVTKSARFGLFLQGRERIWTLDSISDMLAFSWNLGDAHNRTGASGKPLGDGSGEATKRCQISHEQRAALLKLYKKEKFPTFEERQALSERIGLNPRSVSIWFQNHRQRMKPVQQKSEKPPAPPTRPPKPFFLTPSAIGQPLGGGHCLTHPPPKGARDAPVPAPELPEQSSILAPAPAPADLAAQTGVALGSSAANGGFSSIVLIHAMNELLKANAARSGGADPNLASALSAATQALTPPVAAAPAVETHKHAHSDDSPSPPRSPKHSSTAAPSMPTSPPLATPPVAATDAGGLLMLLSAAD